MTCVSPASLASQREPCSLISHLGVLAAILARQAAREDVASIQSKNREGE